MFKVTLIQPPERSIYEGYRYYLPFSLLYLASYLEDHQIITDIVDIKLGRDFIGALKSKILTLYDLLFGRNVSLVRGNLFLEIKNKIIEEAKNSRPNLIGISCITREYRSVMSIAAELKKELMVPIVVGGIHPSLYPEQFIYEGSPVDFVVIGEGEDALLELARNLSLNKSNYGEIDGIAFLKGGRCHMNNVRTLKDEFTISPINAYHKINMQFYTRPHPYVIRYVATSGTQIFTSRGCPYKCTFCSNPLIWKMNKSYKPIRYRTIESVIKEIVFLRENYQIDSFYIMDDTFCIDKKRVEEFCSELKNSGLNLAWGAETRSNLVNEPLLRIMKKAGLVQLDIGVESGSNVVLQEIQKGITVEDTFYLFSLMHKYGIRGFANIMINLPNETLEQLQETISLLEKIRPSSGSIGVTVPLPKTELFNKYIAPKIKDEKELINLIDRETNYYKITDERFRLAKYDINFQELINKLTYKHYRFSYLQWGFWYWKLFFKSRKKAEYIYNIIKTIVTSFEAFITNEVPKKIMSLLCK